MKTIQINGQDVTVKEIFALEKTIEMIASISFAQAIEYEGGTFAFGGNEYQTTVMESLGRNPLGDVIAIYQRRGEVEELQEELQEAKSEISGIRDAIAALGDGIPTLSKLRAFLEAVKEAIKYGNND